MSLVGYEYDPGEEQEILDNAAKADQRKLDNLDVCELVEGERVDSKREWGRLTTAIAEYRTFVEENVEKDYLNRFSPASSAESSNVLTIDNTWAANSLEVDESHVLHDSTVEEETDLLSIKRVHLAQDDKAAANHKGSYILLEHDKTAQQSNIEEQEISSIPQSMNQSVDLMPEIPDQSPSQAMLEHIAKLVAYQKMGTTVNGFISNWLSFKNPYLLEEIMREFNIDAYCSNYPIEVFNPSSVLQKALEIYDNLDKPLRGKEKADANVLATSEKPHTAAGPFHTAVSKSAEPPTRGNRFSSKWDSQTSAPVAASFSGVQVTVAEAIKTAQNRLSAATATQQKGMPTGSSCVLPNSIN